MPRLRPGEKADILEHAPPELAPEAPRPMEAADPGATLARRALT